MIDKRLLRMIGSDKKFIYGNVLFQWLSLIANIIMMYFIANLIGDVYAGTAGTSDVVTTLIVAVLAIAIRYICTRGSSDMSYQSSKAVKKLFRTKIYEKLLRLGPSYQEQIKSSEVVQVSVEGVDQLETYFGAYIPQFIYAMLAPFTLMIAVGLVNWSTAVILFFMVWLIPVVIMGIQTWAKKLLSKYLDNYYKMGDHFLENLQGMTTLKIYQADERRAKEMDDDAESFRKITMKVLTMQLNSVTIMDLITYAGGAVGVILAVLRLRSGAVDLSGAMFIILLAIEFFTPMRRLGSYFHIAMNGMTASKKMFALLELPEPQEGTEAVPAKKEFSLDHVTFAYNEGTDVLKDISMKIPQGQITAVVGESGSGKSTIASILMTRSRGYEGSVKMDETELCDISEAGLLDTVTYIGNDSFLFKGTVRDNLLMAAPNASDEDLWGILDTVNLSEFLRSENGLETELQEQGTNFSGGQRQRLALARGLLHDSAMYIFDEATSNIDMESEETIMESIYHLGKEGKTVLLISHRLANVTDADCIYCLQHGEVVGSGAHEDLLATSENYASLWNTQRALETYGKEAVV